MQENQNNSAPEQSAQEMSEILRVRREKLEELKDSGKNPFEITTYARTTTAKEIVDNFADMEGSEVSIAGRMMSCRKMGKASFLDIRDASGRIQVYARLDGVGEENYREFKKWDIGDILGVEGTAFRTQKGEISVKATSLKLLSKSLQPLPEKWHGLKDLSLIHILPKLQVR